MKKSDSINELATALAKVQGEIKSAGKDGTNPHFKSSYATLASVWDAARLSLSKHGLSVSQGVEENEKGFMLDTLIMHSSGQWLSSQTPVLMAKIDMQSLGSAITYARRYALSSMVGIVADDDDDGEAATGRAGSPHAHFQNQSRATPAPSQQKPIANPQASPAAHSGTGPRAGVLTDAQIKRLFTIAGTNGWNVEQVKACLSEMFQIDSTSKLTRVQYDELCDIIFKHPPSHVTRVVDDVPSSFEKF